MLTTTAVITLDYDQFTRNSGALCGDGVVLAGVFASNRYRFIQRYPLTALPSQGLVVESVELRMTLVAVGGLPIAVPIVAYGGDGQDDPSGDTCADRWAKCAVNQTADQPYVPGRRFVTADASTTVTIPLGAQVARDIAKAKQAVDRFSIGFSDQYAAGTGEVVQPYHFTSGINLSQLLITYRQHHLPSAAGQRRQRGHVTDANGLTITQVLS